MKQIIFARTFNKGKDNGIDLDSNMNQTLNIIFKRKDKR